MSGMAVANAVRGMVDMAGPVDAADPVVTEAERLSSELYHWVADVPMKLSCTEPHYQEVLRLLRCGADPNYTKNGRSVLIACAHQRCGYYDWEVAHLLIEWGADRHFLYQEKNAAQWIAWRAGFGAEELQAFIDNFVPTARSRRALVRGHIV